MHMLFRLFGPRRRKNQEDIAIRAAEVIVQVLFDIGLARFLGGTVVLDRQFRIRFYGAPPQPSGDTIASIALRELEEARAFHAHVLRAGIDAPALERQARVMADAILRELRTQSPALRALPAARRERRTDLRAA
ncbi:hypothetical protein LE190_10460 [Massilia oculi]|uniref:Fis family transcriptional regulator n=1 Tax=Massilia hydrophila TaxID=3044279 RepID=A0ABS7Y9I9_9BURK|nr:hypothetical protein [Massilia oculi]MCA1856343.1 hypothetical protein [Massilia oculi]